MGEDNRSENSGSFWERYRRQRREGIQAAAASVQEGPYFMGRPPFVLLLILALVGAFAAAFLTYRHILLVSTSGSVAHSPLCSPGAKINCDAILMTEYSVLWDFLPSAALGLMGVGFALWLIVNALANDKVRKVAWTLLLVYYCAAIGFSWHFAYIMAFKVHFICTWCIVVHVTNVIALLTLIVISFKRSEKFLLPEIASLGERVYFVAGGVLFSLLILLVSLTVEYGLSFRDAKIRFEELANDPVVVMAILESTPDYDLPINREDPVYGRAHAKYPIVMFTDFQCPVCAETEEYLRRLVEKNPEHLKLVFKSYPLSTDCNKLLTGNLHPHACEAARAAYAAYFLQGNRAFWPYAAQLFAKRGRLNQEIFTDIAEQMGLDKRRFVEMLQEGSPADRKMVDDIRLGIELKLSSTPQIFFLGKRLPENYRNRYMVHMLEDIIHMKHPDREKVIFRSP